MKYQWMEKIMEKEIGRLYSTNVSYEKYIQSSSRNLNGTDSLEEPLIDGIIILKSMLMK
jgi:hypothetical protein